MQQKTLFEGIKCLTRRYTILALLIGAILINILFFVAAYVLYQHIASPSIWHFQFLLFVVTCIVVICVVSIFLINLDGIRDEMVVNLKKLISIIRNQTSQDFAKKIEIEEVSCDDEVFEIVSVLNKRSEEIEKYINHLKYVIGYIQHEFNTPLATLAIGIERLNKKHPDLDTDFLEDEVHDLSKIMNSLSYLTLKDSNNIVFSSMRAVSIIDKVMCGLKKNYPTASVQYFGNQGMHVISNEIYLHIIFKNLIENAFKYSRDENYIDIHFNGEKSQIQIKDYGIGLTTEELQKIGLPFWQADGSRGKDNGFGLGLTLVYELAEILGIHIQVNSKKDIGTLVTLQFSKK